MNKDIDNTDQADDFMKAFRGKFYGVLRWHQLDKLWEKVINDKDQGWYLYALGEEVPQKISQGDQVVAFIDSVNTLLRREHDEEYCGIVYADNIDAPRFIKVFDPNNIGTSCSIAKEPPPPAWVISKLKPQDLLVKEKQTANRRRWWQSIFKKS